MRKKKGFTLMELTIVLAITSILIAIVVPSWSYYLQRSRIKAQNAKSKVIFNAAQTIITDLEFYERHHIADYFNADTSNAASFAATQSAAQSMLYTGVLSTYNNTVGSPDYGTQIPGAVSEWYFYWDGSKGYICDASCNPTAGGTSATNTWNTKISNSIRKIARSDEVYRIYVKNYTVVSVVTAREERDQYLGSHPVTLDERKAAGKDTKSDIKAKRRHGIKGVNMSDFELGSLDAPDEPATE